jgi:putative ABC transport system permease protein
MRPESPGKVGKVFLEHWAGLWRRLDIAWKMSLRTINRNRFRTAVTLVGVVFAVGMLIVSLFMRDMTNYMLEKQFYQDQRYDYFIHFTGPLRQAELTAVSRLDGVVKTEPVFEAPVRIHFKGRSQEELLMGMPSDVGMKVLWSDTGHPLALPEEGLLLSRSTAVKLGAGPGDTVRLESLLGLGPTRWSTMQVAGVVEEFVGGTSYTSLAQANRVVQESRLVTGAMLKVDPGFAAQLEEELKEMTGVTSIMSRQKLLDGFKEQLGYMYYFVAIMAAFAIVLGFAIVYNASVMSFAERKRELASLRVTGFTVGEVSGLLLKENLLQTLTGVALGLPFGRLLADAYISAVMQSETYAVYSFAVVVYPITYVLSALGGVLFITAACRLVLKNVGRLDLVEVLKTRD